MTTTNTIDINNINFRESGIYDANFYYSYKIKFNLDENRYMQFEDWEKLQEENNYFEDEVELYINNLDQDYKASQDESDLKVDAIDFIISRIIHKSECFYRPQFFNQEVAKKCKILTFIYDGIELFAITGYEEFWKLDAYQALVDNTIDKNSKLFSDYSYFKYVANEELTQEVIKAIHKN